MACVGNFYYVMFDLGVLFFMCILRIDKEIASIDKLSYVYLCHQNSTKFYNLSISMVSLRINLTHVVIFIYVSFIYHRIYIMMGLIYNS